MFEHQCILSKCIQVLVETYPIPKEPDHDDNDQIEGTPGMVTGGYPYRNIQLENKQDDEFNDQEKYDSIYICPIRKKLMKTPVIAIDGITYEKEAIIKYMKQHHATPTGVQITVGCESLNDFVFPDHELEIQIKKLESSK